MSEEQFPQICFLCGHTMESADDRTFWHGLGNCVEICVSCTGSGINHTSSKFREGTLCYRCNGTGIGRQFLRINDEAEYAAAIKRIEQLMDAKRDTPQGDELNALATAVEAYENKHFPISQHFEDYMKQEELDEIVRVNEEFDKERRAVQVRGVVLNWIFAVTVLAIIAAAIFWR